MIKRALILALLLLPSVGLAQITINSLPAATIPLAGTEVVPLYQGGHTKQATVLSLLPVPLQGCTAPSVACANGIGAAGLGANTDITSLGGLTTPLSVPQGGTGLASTAQNKVFAGPTSGAGAPAWRLLVSGDIPSLSSTYLPLVGGTLSGPLTISTNAAPTPPQPQSGDLIQLTAADGSTTYAILVGFGTSPGSVLRLYSAGGTAASPAATPVGNQMGNITVGGYDSSAAWGNGFLISTLAEPSGSTWTSSDHGARVNFNLAKAGSTSLTTAIELDGTNNLISLGGPQASESLQIPINLASIVNPMRITGGTTGNGPTLLCTGSDTNVSCNITPTGTGTTSITSGGLGVTGGISSTGSLTSTIATGTPPLVVTSTTNVPNLNASSLGGATFAAPGPIGSGTPGTGAFTTLAASGAVSGTGFSNYLASPPAIGGTAPSTIKTTALSLASVAESSTAPTISSGFCTSPSVSNNNGTAAFTITIGTSCAASTGVITMPAASHGWACHGNDITTPASYVIGETATTTTSVNVTAYSRTTGVASNWTAADIIQFLCTGY